MEIGQKFKTLSKREYFFYIDNYKKYADFNTLGLYRSIIENEQLSLAERLEVRDYAHKTFRKSFDFLQLKDPNTYFTISTIGQTLTEADKAQQWKCISRNQRKILSEKRIKHRNFGTYSKHSCPEPTCYMSGLMLKQGSPFGERNMVFPSDHRIAFQRKEKSNRRKVDRKREKQFIQSRLETE